MPQRSSPFGMPRQCGSAREAFHLWSPGEVTEQKVHAQIKAGQWYVVRLGGWVQAALRVLNADPDVWGRDTGNALYVHGLVVDRALSGRGVGAALLGWVQHRARRQGRDRVRLDCVASNEQLHGYYMPQNFRVAGGKSFDNRWSPVVLLEKGLLAGDEGSARTGPEARRDRARSAACPVRPSGMHDRGRFRVRSNAADPVST